MNIIISQEQALIEFFEAHKRLYTVGVLINKKDFTCQLGEWIVEKIYNGKRAKSGIQKGWDVEVNGKYIQVKAHAKAAGNKARFSRVEKFPAVQVDELIIIVFTHDYKFKHFFKLPWQIAQPFIKERGKKEKKFEISWSKLSKYEVDINTLPHQEIISLFI